MKYFKRSYRTLYKEERIQSVLPKQDCLLTRLMLTLLSSVKKLLIASAVYETKQSLVGGYLHVYAFIDSELYGKA